MFTVPTRMNNFVPIYLYCIFVFGSNRYRPQLELHAGLVLQTISHVGQPETLLMPKCVSYDDKNLSVIIQKGKC